MSSSHLSLALLAAATIASLTVPVVPAAADEGDPAGWSVSVDPRGRAFLKWVSAAEGPRVLLLGCLRDVDEFFVSAKAVPGTKEGADVELQLIVADAEWRISGSVARTEDGETTFEKEMELAAKARRKLGKDLMRVLSAPGPIVLQIGNSATIELPLEDLPPRAGIAAPLKKFEAVCFAAK